MKICSFVEHGVHINAGVGFCGSHFLWEQRVCSVPVKTVTNRGCCSQVSFTARQRRTKGLNVHLLLVCLFGPQLRSHDTAASSLQVFACVPALLKSFSEMVCSSTCQENAESCPYHSSFLLGFNTERIR